MIHPSRLLLLAAALFAWPAAASGPGQEWTVEKADAGGLVLLWENRALGREGEALPRSAALGVPAGARPAGSLEVLEEKAATSPLPAGNRDLPSSAASGAWNLALSQPARYRDLEVSSLSLATSSGGRVLARARIRVDFRDPGGARPAFAPDAGTAPELHLRSWLINYAQSRGFRGAPAQPARGLAKSAASGFAAGPSPGASLPRIRLVIKTASDNIEVVTYEALRKAGAPVDKIDPRHMRLFHDGVEAPMYISGGDDGRWNPGDYLEFIGKRARGTRTHNNLYTSTSAFILTWEGGRLGLRAPAVPVTSRGQGPLAPGRDEGAREAPPYKASVRLEEDLDVLRIGSTAVEEIADLGARVRETELTDFWMWQNIGSGSDTRNIPFTLDHYPVPRGEGGALNAAPLRIRINLKGITNNPKADPDHHLKFILNGKDISLVDGVANDAIWEGQEPHTWESRDLDPAVLKPGKQNVLVLQKVNDLRTSDGSPVELQDAYLNWVELEFPSGYRAWNDHLRFSNDFADSLGARLFNLDGFSKPDLSVWDLGGRKLIGYRVDSRDGAYGITLVDTLAGPTRYIACTLDRREAPSLALDTLPDLVSPAEGADWLVITHRDLLGGALDSLAAHRKQQGLRCKVVLADHIYQAFGDGSMDPAAIRRFVEHAYRTWPRPAPAYLLLVGETSLWYEKRYGQLQRTLVPTQLVNVEGWGVAANDDYFAKVSGDDAVADLFVGRIPVASREDLSKVVRKTLALENRRPAGHWANKALLVSGFEEGFMAQNGRLQALAASHDRQFSRLDLYPKSPHYRAPAERGGFFDQLDSAFSLVSFVGHGGGAVWSDAGVLTLRHLDEGRLKGDYPITLVSSVTCLTGYFEDVSERSLGEELLRLEQGGAAAFYGAAGYISNLAGEALSYEILRAAASGSPTVGSVVRQAETMVHLKTDGAYTPVLSEFNLLGDPALRLSFPPAAGSLDLGPRILSGAGSLEIKGRDLDLGRAEGMVTLLLGDSALGAWPVTVSDGAFTLQRDLAGLSGPVPDGKALVHYWTNAGGRRESRIASAPFTTLDWLIDSVRMEPQGAAPGDSVTLSLRLGTAQGQIAVDGGVAFYALGGETSPLFPRENQAALRTAEGGRLETRVKVVVPVPEPGMVHPRLHVAFRLSARVVDGDGKTVSTLPALASRVYSLEVSDLGRLSFAEPAFRIPVQDDLGVWVVFRNTGLGKASGFSVRVTTDAEGPNPGTDAKSYAVELALGGVDSLFFPLADSLVAGRRLRAALVPARPGELADKGTEKDTLLRILTRRLDREGDSLILDSATAAFLPSGGKPHRVFLERVTVAALPAHLAPASGSLPAEAWLVRSPTLEASGLGLARHGSPAALKPSAARTADDRPFWHFHPGQPGPGSAQPGPWLKLDTLGPGLPWTGKAWRDGLYGLFLNRDATPPLIQFSSRGQALLQDDYVPRNTPINVVVRDAEGVDLSLRPPTLDSRRQAIDSSNLAAEASAGFPSLVRLNFLPRHGTATDSVTVTATDVSGNRATRTLAYRRGEELAIRNLGSYPNPFADTAIFVYSLTDYCDKVQLKVFSRAGRLVRTLEERNVVGYREVVWDGRAESGGSIGNGLYFLQVTAQGGGKEATQVFKLFKKRRK